METASNIIISILSSIIGGLFTFGGVWLTIKHEQKKERRNYLESIKPYLVVQHLVDLSKSEIQNIKTLSIPNDSAAPLPSLTQTSVVYHWENLVLTNVSNSTGIFAYIKINSSPYAFPTKSPIKPFETFQIIGNLISILYSLLLNLSHLAFTIAISICMNILCASELKSIPATHIQNFPAKKK